MTSEGREALFRTWLTEHGAAVLKVARAYTFTAADCQDLVQEILLEVWRSLPRFRGDSRPSTWVYRVALNTALGWHRKENRRRARQRSIVEIADLPASGAESAWQAAQLELLERLYSCIRRLPRTDSALVLLYLDDLSYRDIAEVLGISESNVGVKLNRAKRALRDLMNETSHGK